MEQATRLYKQYLEDARNLAKIGNDEVTLLKAIAFANIANAIGSTGFVNVSEIIEEDNGVKAEQENKDNRKFVEGKASLKRTPNPKEETVKTEVKESEEDKKAREYIESDEFKKIENIVNYNSESPTETRENCKMRYDYLIRKFGDKKMKEVPSEYFFAFKPEKGLITTVLDCLTSWKADIEAWKTKIASECSESGATSFGDLTVTEYLNTMMPALYHLLSVIDFQEENRAELLSVLNTVSAGAVKKIEDICMRNVDFLHVGLDKYLDGTFDDVKEIS